MKIFTDCPVCRTIPSDTSDILDRALTPTMDYCDNLDFSTPRRSRRHYQSVVYKLHSKSKKVRTLQTTVWRLRRKIELTIDITFKRS